MSKIIGITTATPYAGVPELTQEVANLKGEVSTIAESTRYPKEIYKEQLDLSSIGGDETEWAYMLTTVKSIELEANEEYIFSIPCSKYGNGVIRLESLTLTHDGEKYTCRYTPTDDTTFEVETLIVEYISSDEFYGAVDLVVEKMTPIAQRLGDVETALDSIIAIQEELIGGGSV